MAVSANKLELLQIVTQTRLVNRPLQRLTYIAIPFGEAATHTKERHGRIDAATGERVDAERV